MPFDTPVLLLDSGANPTVTEDILNQWAIIGSAYSSAMLGVEKPRVGLLNNGTEEHKGTPVMQAAYQLLKENKHINFVGNVEARDVPMGVVDVVVSDGFSGNVLLKSIEGTAMFMGSLISKMFKKNLLSKLAAMLVMKDIKAFKKLLDYRETGGTLFLGVQKTVIKAHGSSDQLAFRNAVRQASEAAQRDFSVQLAEGLSVLKEIEND